MNIFEKTWNQVFSRDKSASKGKVGPLSPEQCRAAGAVFGVSDPNVQKVCGIDYSALGKAAYKQIEKQTGLDEILENFKIAIEAMQEEIMQLDEFMHQNESRIIEEQQEKLFFTPRGTRMMYGDKWLSGNVPTRKTSKNRDTGTQNKSWIDEAQGVTKPIPKPQSQNIYGAHDLREGKLRF